MWNNFVNNWHRNTIEEFEFLKLDHMKWDLIFKLSLFGLAMAFATVYVIPSNLEPFFWLAIFIFCAWQIAKNCNSRFFLHGFLVSIFNCIWITAVHILLYNKYISNHRNEADMMSKMGSSPRLMMLLIGPMIGIVSGLVLGVFSIIAAKLLRRKLA